MMEKIDKQTGKKRYWLRGGVIGLVAGVLLIGVLFGIVTTFPSNGVLQSLFLVSMIVFVPFIIIFALITLPFRPESASTQSSIAAAYLFTTILPLSIIIGSIIYGILIGYFYGKIKNRNKTK